MGPLHGIKVLDLSRILAGPWATQCRRRFRRDRVQGREAGRRRALALLEVIDAEGLLARVRETGEWLQEELRSLAARQPKVAAVLDRALLVAIDLTVPAKPLALAAEERGFLVNAVQEQTLRLAPPFLVTKDELRSFIAAIEQILAAT